MEDIFKHYELQREELLARIAQQLQLDDTRKGRMESAYRSISTLLDQDQGFFKDLDVDVYPQGSVLIGTTVRPYQGSEFDLDIVVQINALDSRFTPTEIYNALLKKLEDDDHYSDKIAKKNRCVRINYSNDFHMDILPGCIVSYYDKNIIRVPDRALRDWTTSNPKGFGDWFLARAASIRRESILQGYYNRMKIELRAQIEELPRDEFYNKSPLQRAVQLVKRYRDVYFSRSYADYATSSIVLTTLMGLNYQGEPSIYETIDNALNRIKLSYNQAQQNRIRFTITNPVNDQEHFTDSWTAAHYDHFYRFVDKFHREWNALKEGFDRSGQHYIELFDEGVYKESLQEQIKALSKFSQSPVTKANGLIIGGNALTNAAGRINQSQGYKNTPHHNYGE
jgi:hypothetical protein